MSIQIGDKVKVAFVADDVQGDVLDYVGQTGEVTFVTPRGFETDHPYEFETGYGVEFEDGSLYGFLLDELEKVA